MPTATENQQPATSPRLRRLVARHPAAAFLVMAFGFGWTSLIPILLAENGFGVLPIELPLTVVQMLATVLGLALPAFLVTAATGGKEGVRDRAGCCGGGLESIGTSSHSSGSLWPCWWQSSRFSAWYRWRRSRRSGGLLFTVFLPGVILPFLHTNLWEELGWAGFLQSTLQDRHGPLLASIMVAPVFALFHLPAYFVAGWIVEEHTPLSQLPNVLIGYVSVVAVFAIFFRILVIWLYNITGRSVFLVALFHSAFNMTTGQKITPDLLHLPEGLAALIPAAVIAVIAVLLVVFTKGRLAYERKRRAT
jgi:uncharacterized protein